MILGLAWLGVVVKTRGELERLRALSSVPPGNLAVPSPGPAIYKGRLYSKVPRTSPMGKPSAAFWWWVEQKQGKNTWKTVCSDIARDSMELRGEGGKVSLALFDGGDLSLLADTRDDWSEKRVIDLGALKYDRPTTFPDAAANCFVKGRTYTERRIAPGANVEVLACYSDGALRDCPGAMAGVLGVPTIKIHVDRREAYALNPTRGVAVFSLVLLTGGALLALRMRKRVLGAVSSKGGAS